MSPSDHDTDPQDTTQDPKLCTARGGGGGGALSASPHIDILFHPDLRRVGDCHSWSARSSERVVIGRTDPLFHSGVSAAPLDDPCISRHQCAVRYHAEQRVFEVEKGRDARREMRVLDAGGAVLGELTESSRPVPPGSYVVIGDRLLLRLSLRVPSADMHGMIGISDAIASVRRKVEAVARMTEWVLVTGETGVGKELVACAIHKASDRRTAPFVAVNCPQLPPELVESELFGHTKGAFSGAGKKRPGLLRSAGRGTVLLDEIAELSPAIQAKLLRTVEVRKVRPVGADADAPLDARLLFATHRDLQDMVARGAFREDLYRRIETPQLHVPPLRERREDVPLLFARFVCDNAQAATLGLVKEVTVGPPRVPLQHVLNLLDSPLDGNVRGLKRHVEQMVFDVAVHGHFVAPLASAAPRDAESPSPSPPSDSPSEEPGRRLPEALERNGYNQTRTAIDLGVARSTLVRWMVALGLRNGARLDATEIHAALAPDADVCKAAHRLGVSERALRLRMTELRIKP